MTSAIGAGTSLAEEQLRASSTADRCDGKRARSSGACWVGGFCSGAATGVGTDAAEREVWVSPIEEKRSNKGRISGTQYDGGVRILSLFFLGCRW